jgi:hypothetical protein
MAEKGLQEIQAEIARIELETAQIRLEQMKEENETYRARKAARLRANEQNLAQLRADHAEKRAVIATCTHRQGGSPGRERKGGGPSALRVVILPDSRELVMCANCPLRVFSPFPGAKNPAQMRGESKAEAKARVEQYSVDLTEFERLKELSQDQLTPEAASPMHCGKTFAFAGGDGNNMMMPAPCDEYAQGLDNRQAV